MQPSGAANSNRKGLPKTGWLVSQAETSPTCLIGIDATFAMAKGGGAEIGATKRGKGLKMLIAMACRSRSVRMRPTTTKQLCFDFYMIEAKPENLIGDRAYDSDPLDEQLRRHSIEMIAPHRSNRSKPRRKTGADLDDTPDVGW